MVSIFNSIIKVKSLYLLLRLMKSAAVNEILLQILFLHWYPIEHFNQYPEIHSLHCRHTFFTPPIIKMGGV